MIGHEIWVWARPFLGLLGRKRWCFYASYRTENNALTEWFHLQRQRRYPKIRLSGPGYSYTKETK